MNWRPVLIAIGVGLVIGILAAVVSGVVSQRQDDAHRAAVDAALHIADERIAIARRAESAADAKTKQLADSAAKLLAQRDSARFLYQIQRAKTAASAARIDVLAKDSVAVDGIAYSVPAPFVTAYNDQMTLTANSDNLTVKDTVVIAALRAEVAELVTARDARDAELAERVQKEQTLADALAAERQRTSPRFGVKTGIAIGSAFVIVGKLAIAALIH